MSVRLIDAKNIRIHINNSLTAKIKLDLHTLGYCFLKDSPAQITILH